MSDSGPGCWRDRPTPARHPTHQLPDPRLRDGAGHHRRGDAWGDCGEVAPDTQNRGSSRAVCAARRSVWPFAGHACSIHTWTCSSEAVGATTRSVRTIREWIGIDGGEPRRRSRRPNQTRSGCPGLDAVSVGRFFIKHPSSATASWHARERTALAPSRAHRRQHARNHP